VMRPLLLAFLALPRRGATLAAGVRRVAVASTEQSGSRASLSARGVLGLTLASLTALALAAAVHRRRTRATE
jgi:hypothetical protein